MAPDDGDPESPQLSEADDPEQTNEASCCSECNCSGYAETTPLPTMKCNNCGHASSSHSC